MGKIKVVSAACLQLVAACEGLRLKAYNDPVGIPTIGIGTTRYPDGRRVRIGDTCTKEQAFAWLQHDIAGASKDVDDLTTDAVKQCQFDALVSLVYNIGRGQYAGSTVRRLVNANPQDPAIRKAFGMWKKGDGKILPGLVKRRSLEADLYFSC